MDVICLHGFASNAETLNKQVKKLFRGTDVKIHCLNGSVKLPEGYAWWITDKEDPMSISWSRDNELFHIEESARVIADYCSSFENYGLLGFSQGGGMVDYLLKTNIVKPRFAIFVGTFSIGGPIPPPACPSLHIYGEKDEIIPMWSSQLLADDYPGGLIYQHPGTHILPTKASVRELVKKLITQ